MFKHIGSKSIETERLILRKFIDKDAVDMYIIGHPIQKFNLNTGNLLTKKDYYKS